MKQTHIEIDECLVAEALRSTGLGSMEALVDYALRELLSREQVKCHCPYSEEPQCRFRWTHPEVAGICRSGHEIAEEVPGATRPLIAPPST